ncbi:MAG: galactokinase, partial [Spirochaetales bacterium]|nr:galactokinase [Spirochaetales bacterium]
GGNHTDHNNGLVLAGSINLDSIAVVSKSMDNKIKLFSEGYDLPFLVDLNYLEPNPAENGTTNALIRGVAARLKQLGYKIEGFKAFISSDVLPGSGLSSSASIEVLIGSIFNAMFNDNSIAPEILAQVGQFAENNYLGKPCGLMDQMACAVGGIISIDFKDPAKPVFNKVNFNFDKQNYKLLVLDTGGSHADLTDDYSAIPAEMKSVAELFGVSVLREINIESFVEKIPYVRKQLGDRAILRALHFLQENDRVVEEVKALESGDFSEFLKLVKASGNSSFKWLQNIFTTKNIKEQGVSLALALSEKYIEEIGQGACRVHGGGFAGTIQIFLPDNKVEEYKNKMEKIFGKNSVQVLNIRQIGTVYLNGL